LDALAQQFGVAVVVDQLAGHVHANDVVDLSGLTNGVWQLAAAKIGFQL